LAGKNPYIKRIEAARAKKRKVEGSRDFKTWKAARAKVGVPRKGFYHAYMTDKAIPAKTQLHRKDWIKDPSRGDYSEVDYPAGYKGVRVKRYESTKRGLVLREREREQKKQKSVSSDVSKRKVTVKRGSVVVERKKTLADYNVGGKPLVKSNVFSSSSTGGVNKAKTLADYNVGGKPLVKSGFGSTLGDLNAERTYVNRKKYEDIFREDGLGFFTDLQRKSLRETGNAYTYDKK